MTKLTIVFSNHRCETLQLVRRVIKDHQRIILEEPPHPDFARMLTRQIDLEDYLLSQEYEYPEFSRRQAHLLQELSRGGMGVIQVEPYLERLFRIQCWLADGHRPEELDQSSTDWEVYRCEREATRLLIDYYHAAGVGQFPPIITAMQAFARADGARFLLRDRLRAAEIGIHLPVDMSTCIEAGPMHLHLFRDLTRLLPANITRVAIKFPEHRVIRDYGYNGSMYSPGDILTIHHIFGHSVVPEQEELLCAQALIYNTMIPTEEQTDDGASFPHLTHEMRIIDMVKRLSMAECQALFERIKGRSRENSMDIVTDHWRKNSKIND